jgi:glycosyltransferase involved in cell wall biosynthesis
VVELAAGLHYEGVPVIVVTFYKDGALAGDLERAGVPRYSVGKGGRWDVFGFFFRLVRLLRQLRPSIIYGFLATANIVAVLSKPWVPGARIVWGIRASHVDLAKYDTVTRITYGLERLLTPLTDLIIANSEAGKFAAVSVGFPAAKTVVVPNGIDTSRFFFDEAGRRRVRAAWGIQENERVVGLVARFDPMKDHPTFLRAARRIIADCPDARFVCIGDGSPQLRKSLQDLAQDLELEGYVIWSDARQDMPAVFSAFDVACSASAFGEGFSNSVVEAMACGAPCVGTSVGDVPLILADVGIIVPPADSDALADAITRLLRMDRGSLDELRERARRRVVEDFSVKALVCKTQEAWSIFR